MQDGPTSDVARAGLVVAGKFRLDSMIGQGGMGSVWAATHLALGNRIAIKLVSREFVRSAEALRRFDAEAKAAALLQSRHVVQVYDSGSLEDSTPYIAMELLSGENLQQRIERIGAVSLAETVNILAQCGKALGRAHSMGIIHRDIKPDNIFLATSPDDDDYVVKILDFGVAKLTIGNESDQSSTRTGTVLGTPLYMSPEQARGLKGIDHRTDLYSLGLVGYTMLTGRIAFSGESFGDILLKICTEPLPAIGSIVSVPPAVEAWFQRACARDPGARYPSAQEFVEALRVAAGVSQMSQSGERQTGASGMRNPHVAPTLIDSGFGGPPAPPPYGQSTPGANVALSAAGVPKSRIAPAAIIGAIAAFVVIAGAGLVAMTHHGHDAAAAPPSSPIPPPAPEPLPSAVPQPVATLAPPPPETASAIPPAPPPAPATPAKHGGHTTPLPAHTVVPVAPAPPPEKPSPAPQTPGKIDLGY